MTSVHTAYPVSQADSSVRSTFIIKVYQHLLLAVAAFMGFEAILFASGIAERIHQFLAASGGVAWLVILGGFSVVNLLATRSAHRLDDPTAQYLSLFGVALAQALIFAPFLYQVFNTDGTGTVVEAAVITAVGFAGLSVIGLVTRTDLSFMRPLVMWGGFCAIGLIIAAVLFNLNLGVWFSVGMIALAGASILYQTQAALRTYPEWAYVGAAVGLFGSLMTMFWYVLRLLSRR